MRRVVYTALADEDLKQTWDYIAADSTFYATRYVERLRAKIRFLATLSNPGRPRKEIKSANIRGYT